MNKVAGDYNMKNEWDMFAAVQQRLAAGEQLVTMYFDQAVNMSWANFPFDEQRGQVLDEDGTEYELGPDYKRALDECIRGNRISWGIRLVERTLCFGPGVNAKTEGEKADYSFGPDDEFFLKSE